MNGPAQAAQGGFRLFSKATFLLGALFLLVVILIHAAYVGSQTGDYSGLIIEPASRLVSADAGLLHLTKVMEDARMNPVPQPEGFMGFLKMVGGIIWNSMEAFTFVYFIFVNFYMWYKFVEIVSPNGGFMGYSLLSFMFMAAMENIWSLYTIGTLAVPMLGLVTFGLYFVGQAEPVFKFLYEHLATRSIPFFGELPPPAEGMNLSQGQGIFT